MSFDEFQMTAAEPLSPATDLGFASAFAKANEAQWRQLVDKVLKGAPFERLISTTSDGIAIQPLYASQTEERPRALRQKSGPWLGLTRIDHVDAMDANTAALNDLENGARGLQIVFADAPNAFGFGLPNGRSRTWSELLERVRLDADIRVVLDLSPQGLEIAQGLTDWLVAQAIPASATDIGFGLDPIGHLAFSGQTPELAPIIAFAQACWEAGFKGPVFGVDGRIIHAAGGSEAQELSFMIASAIAYLRALEAEGVPLERARQLIGFRMAADADQFLTLSKTRALRRLWARIEQACGLEPAPLRLHVETAWRMTSRIDPWVNILRGTMACFAAGLGGADSICVLPLTQALGLPDEFARRIARNTQLVLIEESHLGVVSDPAAGAGGIEALTDDLCLRAWAGLQAIERAGGMIRALETGAFQKQIHAVQTERARQIARRKVPLTGVSEFPDIFERPLEVLRARQDNQDVSTHSDNRLVPQRQSAPFEVLRAKGLAAQPPARMFLANLGPVAAFSARAMFAKNLFEAGGIATLSNDGFANVAACVDAFKASGTDLVCLCSSDALYGEQAVDMAHALKLAGAKHIFLAGRPGELEAALRQAGVDEFIFAGMDVLAILTKTFSLIEADQTKGAP